MTRNTASDLSDQYVGRTAMLEVRATNANVQEPMFVRVKVTDAKVSYGRLNVLIEPLDGLGSQWVTPKRLSFEE